MVVEYMKGTHVLHISNSISLNQKRASEGLGVVSANPVIPGVFFSSFLLFANCVPWARSAWGPREVHLLLDMDMFAASVWAVGVSWAAQCVPRVCWLFWPLFVVGRWAARGAYFVRYISLVRCPAVDLLASPSYSNNTIISPGSRI